MSSDSARQRQRAEAIEKLYQLAGAAACNDSVKGWDALEVEIGNFYDTTRQEALREVRNNMTEQTEFYGAGSGMRIYLDGMIEWLDRLASEGGCDEG